GVAVRTVYLAFGSKQGVLTALVDLIGEDAGELETREQALGLTDGREIIRLVAHLYRNLYERGADVIDMVRQGAAVEEDLRVALGVVGAPDHVRDVLGTELDAFRWGRVFRNLSMVVGRRSMLVSDGEEHRRRRALVQPGFARRRLDSWIPLVVAEVDRLVDETLEGAESEPVAADLCDFSRVLVR